MVAAAFGTVVLGLDARRPFAIAPHVGENAFIGWPPGVRAVGRR